MDKTLLLAYLDLRRSSLAGNQDGVHLHQTLCEQAPAFYLKLLADPTSEMSHKHEILANVLEQSAAHTIEREQLVATLLRLSLADALAILDGIRRRKINNRRAHDLILSFLLGHQQFPMLAATRKQYIVRLLKHVMGERTWSAATRSSARQSRALSTDSSCNRRWRRATSPSNAEAEKRRRCARSGSDMNGHRLSVAFALSASSGRLRMSRA